MRLSPRLRSFLRQNWLVTAILLMACMACIWFAVDVFLDFLYFNDPRHKDMALKGWMTPRYVVLSYDLPRQEVADILGLTSVDQRRLPMREIAEMNNVTLDELTEIVRKAAADYRAAQQ